MCKIFFAIFIAVLLVSCHISEEKKLETVDEKKSIPSSLLSTWSARVIKTNEENEYYIASIYAKDTAQTNSFCLNVYKIGVNLDELHGDDWDAATGPVPINVEIIGKDKVVYLPRYGYSPKYRPITDYVLNEFKQYLSVHINDTLPGLFYNLPIKPDSVDYYQK